MLPFDALFPGIGHWSWVPVPIPPPFQPINIKDGVTGTDAKV